MNGWMLSPNCSAIPFFSCCGCHYDHIDISRTKRKPCPHVSLGTYRFLH
uniref:Uncharacterized protein n=1 Tax=Setaria italica TaxID=4555 RepID=K3ZP73_SETIT